MNEFIRYVSFNISDTDGKKYRCSRKIQQFGDQFTQIVSVIGLDTLIDPSRYGKTSTPIELMEPSAESLALQILHQNS